MRMLLRGSAPRWLTPALVALAVALTLALTAGPIRLAGANPTSAFQYYLVRPLSSSYTLLEVLLASSPLLFTGLAALVAFRSGYYNIGGEGQFIAGAIAVTAATLAGPDLPALVAIPVGLLVGALAGLVWAFVPAFLRVKRGIDEVVTTLLLNPVALLLLQGLLNGPWRNPKNQFPESAPIGPGWELPRLIGGARIHLGYAVAIVLAVLVWVVLTKTRVGLTSRAVGLSPKGAAFAGIRVDRTLLGAALSSGALAGVGGAVQVMGLQKRLTGEVSSGFGYTGIIVATLAALSVPAAVAAATLLADILVGAESAARALQLPPQMGRVVTATLLLCTVGVLVFRRYRLVIPVLRRRRRPGDARTSGGAS